MYASCLAKQMHWVLHNCLFIVQRLFTIIIIIIDVVVVVVVQPLLHNIQGGPKVGIQFTIHYILYTYFWPTLYVNNYLILIAPLHVAMFIRHPQCVFYYAC
jgi:hypothetical protein